MEKCYVQPYLYFGGRCEEALEFYKDSLNANVECVMRFSESPDPMPPGMLQDGFETKIMHAAFRVGYSLIMASDGCNEHSKFGGFALWLFLGSEAEVDRIFESLSQAGNVQMPPDKTFWSERFGMLTDRFGVNWSIMVQPPGQ